jgi:hypothetical protein
VPANLIIEPRGVEIVHNADRDGGAAAGWSDDRCVVNSRRWHYALAWGVVVPRRRLNYRAAAVLLLLMLLLVVVVLLLLLRLKRSNARHRRREVMSGRSAMQHL